jgi:hypothetical protein
LLIRIDADVLSQVLARWLRARAAPVVIAVDGKVERGARLADGRQVHLLSAYDTSTGIVLAQVQIAAKSNEIPAFTPKINWLATRNPYPPTHPDHDENGSVDRSRSRIDRPRSTTVHPAASLTNRKRAMTPSTPRTFQ